MSDVLSTHGRSQVGTREQPVTTWAARASAPMLTAKHQFRQHALWSTRPQMADATDNIPFTLHVFTKQQKGPVAALKRTHGCCGLPPRALAEPAADHAAQRGRCPRLGQSPTRQQRGRVRRLHSSPRHCL